MSHDTPLYRISFYNEEEVFEIYARSVGESDNLFGFLVIDEIVFDTRQSVVVDPAEERLKLEFKDVKRFHIPSHNLIRIDEVEKVGVAKIHDFSKRQGVTALHTKLTREQGK